MKEHTLLQGNISRQLIGLAAPLLLGNIYGAGTLNCFAQNRTQAGTSH